MACNCKNKVNSYVDISKIQEQSWEDVNALVALDSCNEIIVAEKPDTLTEEDRKKVDSLRLKGKGNKALYNDGEYKITYTSSDIDNQFKNYDTSEQVDKKLENYYTKNEADQNLSSTLENYYTKEDCDNNLTSALEDYYKKEEVDASLENAVFYDENNNIHTKNKLVLGEEHKIVAKQSSGQDKRIFNVVDASTWDNLEIGSEQVKFNIISKNRPTVKLHGEETPNTIAFLSEIEEKKDNLQNQINTVNGNIQNHIEAYTQFKNDTENTVKDIDQRVNKNAQDIAVNSANIQTLRDDFNAAEHFKGYFETYLQIQNIPAEKGAFAWCAETGTVWIYDSTLMTWIDSETAIPDQTVQAYDGTPLMDSEADSGSSNQYARGDHRHPADTTKADKEHLEELELAFNEHLNISDNFNEAVEEALETVNDAIQSLDEKVKTNIQGIAENTADIQTLRDDFNAAEHFKGYFQTIVEIQNIPNETGAFAWCTETGTVWIYDSTIMTWKDAQIEIPDQTVYAYDASPLMDGKASAGTSNLYARGDHKHPADTNKADKIELENYLSLEGNTEATKMKGDIWLGTTNKVYVNDLGNSYLGQDENTQTTVLRGFGGGGIELQTEMGDVKYNGLKIATVNDIPDTSQFVINGENEDKINITGTGFQIQTPSSATLIHESAQSVNNLSVNQYGIYASTSGENKLYYNGSEVATKDDLLTEIEKEKISSLSLEGEGKKFLADDGQYKTLNISSLDSRITALEQQLSGIAEIIDELEINSL